MARKITTTVTPGDRLIVDAVPLTTPQTPCHSTIHDTSTPPRCEHSSCNKLSDADAPIRRAVVHYCAEMKALIVEARRECKSDGHAATLVLLEYIDQLRFRVDLLYGIGYHNNLFDLTGPWTDSFDIIDIPSQWPTNPTEWERLCDTINHSIADTCVRVARHIATSDPTINEWVNTWISDSATDSQLNYVSWLEKCHARVDALTRPRPKRVTPEKYREMVKTLEWLIFNARMLDASTTIYLSQRDMLLINPDNLSLSQIGGLVTEITKLMVYHGLTHPEIKYSTIISVFYSFYNFRGQMDDNDDELTPAYTVLPASSSEMSHCECHCGCYHQKLAA